MYIVITSSNSSSSNRIIMEVITIIIMIIMWKEMYHLRQRKVIIGLFVCSVEMFLWKRNWAYLNENKDEQKKTVQKGL